ncbi:MAG: class I SAM-dependent methyltransferase [Saprospiraceae bacterium]|nr:class I SAM-dependent methyltransferase [Saprospiraceae bacterium]
MICLRYLERIKIYLEYYIKANTIFSVHPTFLYNFIQFVFDTKRVYYDFDILYKIHSDLNRNETVIPSDSFSIQNQQNGYRISEFNKKAGHSLTDYETLYRISIFLHPQNILEFGTCLGTSAISLALAHKKSNLISVEGNSFLSAFCNSQFSKIDLPNCKCLHSDFYTYLKESNLQDFDLFFLDGHHHYESTLYYTREFLSQSTENAIIILDDIHWSKGMYKAWKEIIKEQSVQCSLETMRWGFLFKNRKITKGNYVYIDHKYKPWKIGLY